MEQNPDLFDPCFIILDSDYIVDWWEDNSYLFDNFDSPYMEIKKMRLETLHLLLKEYIEHEENLN